MTIDAKKFDRLAKTVFAPVYPVIAEQILETTDVREGCCLDVGCGAGDLGLAILQQTDLAVGFVDASADMVKLVNNSIESSQLQHRCHAVCSDVSQLEVAPNSVDLIISRGSVFFWEQPQQCFSHLYQTLKPGGWMYIGGGFGDQQLLDQVITAFKARGEEDTFRARIQRNLGEASRQRLTEALDKAGISDYSVRHSDAIGLWFVVHKPR
nr:class I SAM-dependent methyltransferase [uncultured Desulfuromonas sp.]